MRIPMRYSANQLVEGIVVTNIFSLAPDISGFVDTGCGMNAASRAIERLMVG